MLAEHLGVSQSETAAIGDNTLDSEMIAWAGLGACVQNGNEEVKTHYNLKAGKIVSCLVNVKGSLKSLVAYLSSYGNAIGSITASVYRWDENYEKTLKGKVLATATITDFPDNANQQFDFEGLGSGYYLIVLTGTGPDDDYGVAVWTKNACDYAITFVDGVAVDGGLWAEIISG